MIYIPVGGRGHVARMELLGAHGAWWGEGKKVGRPLIRGTPRIL